MNRTLRAPRLGSFSALAAITAALAGSAGTALAAPALRVQVDQHGDFLLIGNTLGYDCALGTGPTAPIVVGTLAPDACVQTAANLSDSSPDVFWQADAPALGQATADTATLPASARTTAVLTIPPGATVTHAFLYWAATNTTGVADTQVTLDRPGVGGFGPLTIDAAQSWVPGVDKAYQSVADVTTVVQQYGSGAFRVSDIDVGPFANLTQDVAFGGFWMVVFYRLDVDPLRNLALFDGFDVVKNGSNQSAALSGFLVPTTGFTGKLGVVAFEGDNSGSGDKLLFNNVALSDAQNPVNNFFNSSRSTLGLPVSVPGDLPQLTGTAGSMSGVDLDVVDITAQLTQGQNTAPLQATTTGDTYFLGGFITSISTFAPDTTTSTKAATDVNGGLLLPGDVLRYTITVNDTGNDATSQTVVTDPLPAQVTFVPGSIKVISGANMGTKTDAAGDDQAEYVAATHSVTVRLGMNANATMGGTIPAGATSAFTFDVKVNAGVTGDIANQASVSASGALGAPVSIVVTDGNGNAAGSPPTVVFVDQCSTNADCQAPTPVCDTAVSPHACVGCLTDSDCGGTMSGKVCETPMDTCIDGCRGTGGNGCPHGQTCSSTTTAIGTCSTPTTSASSSTASSTGAGTGGAGGATASSVAASSVAASSVAASSVAASSTAAGTGGATSGSAAGGNGGAGGNDITEAGGCNCEATPREGTLPWGLGAALAALAVAGRRRRRG